MRSVLLCFYIILKVCSIRGAQPPCPIPKPCQCHWDDPSIPQALMENGIRCRGQKLRSIDLGHMGKTNQTFVTLDFSDNKLDDIPHDYLVPLEESLTDVDLHTNLLITIPIAVRNLAYLEILDVHDNLITDLKGHELEQMNELVSLDISDNKLNQITDDMFTYLTYLQHLFLQMNNISKIDQNSFESNINLQYLDLSGNWITILHPDYFLGLKSLHHLSIAMNILTEIAPKSFMHLGNLSTLMLDYNIIEIIFADSFEGLSKLSYLGLDANQIDEMSNDIFKPLIHLRELSLFANYIVKLNPKSFTNPQESLTFLTLTYNDIEEFDPNFFDIFSNLKYLSFGQDNMNVMPNIRNIQTLKGVSISYSRISRIFPCELPQIKQMTLILWSVSPIACDCHTRWIREWYAHHMEAITMSYMGEYIPWICDSPLKYKGKRFDTIPPENFTCSHGEEAEWCRDTIEISKPKLSITANVTAKGITVNWSISLRPNEVHVSEVVLSLQPVGSQNKTVIKIFTELQDTSVMLEAHSNTEYTVCVECMALFKVVISYECINVKTHSVKRGGYGKTLGMILPWVLVICTVVIVLVGVKFYRYKKHIVETASRADSEYGFENIMYDLQPISQSGVLTNENENGDTTITLSKHESDDAITSEPEAKDGFSNEETDA